MQGVSDLPAKVIQEISDRLSPRDVCNALEVCTAWNQAFGSSVRCLSPFRLEGTGLLQRFPKLQRLDLARITGNVAERDLHQLSQLCCLDYLSLRGCSSISCLAFLATLTGKPTAEYNLPGPLCLLQLSRLGLLSLLPHVHLLALSVK